MILPLEHEAINRPLTRSDAVVVAGLVRPWIHRLAASENPLGHRSGAKEYVPAGSDGAVERFLIERGRRIRAVSKKNAWAPFRART